MLYPKIGTHNGKPCIAFFDSDGRERDLLKTESLDEAKRILTEVERFAAKDFERREAKGKDVSFAQSFLKAAQDALIEFETSGPIELGPEPAQVTVKADSLWFRMYRHITFTWWRFKKSIRKIFNVRRG